MRLRLPELLDERKLSPYEVAKRSEGRISLSTIYRITKKRGRVALFDGALLEALCDVLNVTPGDLLERDGKPKRGAK